MWACSRAGRWERCKISKSCPPKSRQRPNLLAFLAVNEGEDEDEVATTRPDMLGSVVPSQARSFTHIYERCIDIHAYLSQKRRISTSFCLQSSLVLFIIENAGSHLNSVWLCTFVIELCQELFFLFLADGIKHSHSCRCYILTSWLNFRSSFCSNPF